MSYAFLLGDRAGRLVSELDGASSKTLALNMRATGTSSCVVPGRGSDADFLLEASGLLRVYEVDDNFLKDGDRTLLAHHRLIGAEEVAGADAVTVSASFADPTWTMARRYIGKSTTGYVYGDPLNLTDRGIIIGNVIDLANAEEPSGLALGNVTPSSSTYVSGWIWKPAMEGITELTATLDGPEFLVRPVPYANGVIGLLDLSPALFQNRPAAAFEFGDGRLNVQAFRRVVSLDGTMNRAISLPPGYPDNATLTVMVRDDVQARAEQGLLEGTVSVELAVDAFRDDLLRSTLAVRGGPRQTITFDPVTDFATAAGEPTNVPRLARDFNVGDIVPFRATVGDEDPATGEIIPRRRVNVLVRVHGYSVAVDDSGAATPTLTVSPS